MSTKDELLQREDAAWSTFREAFSSVPEGRRDIRTVVPGWSVKDLVWHCAYWANYVGAVLEHLAQGLPVPEDQDGDGLNQAIAKESQAMAWDEVIVGAARGRDHARAALLALPISPMSRRPSSPERRSSTTRSTPRRSRGSRPRIRPGCRPVTTGTSPFRILGRPRPRSTSRWPCRPRSGTTSATGAPAQRWQVPTTPAPPYTRMSANGSGSATGCASDGPRSSRTPVTTSFATWPVSPCSWFATRTACCTASTTCAATAARSSSTTSPRPVRCGRRSSARTTPGPTTCAGA